MPPYPWINFLQYIVRPENPEFLFGVREGPFSHGLQLVRVSSNPLGKYQMAQIRNIITSEFTLGLLRI